MSAAAYILSVKHMTLRIPKIKTLLSLIAAVAGGAAAICWHDVCTQGIVNGIAFCTDVLVPSLFLFMVLTAYLIKSGASLMIAKPFGWLMRLMGLPRESAAAVLSAMIGGYPIGAGCVALLYEQGQISASEANKTACIAVSAGPGFLISYLGGSLLNSAQAGNLLLLAQTASLLLTGLIAGRMIPCSPPPRRKSPPDSGGAAFVASVRSASDATFSMCAMVVLFSAVIEVISSIADGGAADILAGFLEITAGCARLSGCAPLYTTAFFIGFGGLSVHCQIFAALNHVPLNRWQFFMSRLIQGIIAMGAAYIFLMMTPMTQPVFSSAEVPLSPDRSATYAGSGALILAALCFIGSVSSRIRRLKVCAE